MEFERKPGSRDGKPVKGTRRKANRLNEGKASEVVKYVVDADGVKEEKLGSIDKNKRWEQASDMEKEGSAKIYQHKNNDRKQDAATDATKLHQKAKLATQKKEEEEAAGLPGGSGKTKSSKAKKREEMQARDRVQNPGLVEEKHEYIAVTKAIDPRQMRSDKHGCRDGRDRAYCRCSYCMGDTVVRGQKKDNLLRDQGL
jgi:hypothetical protein